MSKRLTLSDQIRRVLERSKVTRYRIAKDTGITQCMLSRFMAGKSGLSVETLERLSEYLGFRITIER